MSLDEMSELFPFQRPLFLESRPEEKTGDEMWKTYLDVVEVEDEAKVKYWVESGGGTIKFVRLTTDRDHYTDPRRSYFRPRFSPWLSPTSSSP